MREDFCGKCGYRCTVKNILFCVVLSWVPTIRNIVILHLIIFRFTLNKQNHYVLTVHVMNVYIKELHCQT